MEQAASEPDCGKGSNIRQWARCAKRVVPEPGTGIQIEAISIWSPDPHKARRGIIL